MIHTRMTHTQIDKVIRTIRAEFRELPSNYKIDIGVVYKNDISELNEYMYVYLFKDDEIVWNFSSSDLTNRIESFTEYCEGVLNANQEISVATTDNNSET